MFIYVTWVRVSFLFKAEWTSVACIYHILFIHSYVNEHLGWFQLLATMNEAAMHMVYKYIVKKKQTNKQKKTNKRKATDWEKIFAKTHLIKDCYLNTQGFLNSTVRKQTTQLKNGPKIFMELLSKKIYKWHIRRWKAAQYHISSN